MTKTGCFNYPVVKNTIRILHRFHRMAQTLGVERTYLLATDAVRKARNNAVFLQQVRETIGLEVEILSHKQEALFSYFGAISGIGEHTSRKKANRLNEKPFIVIDIGGGSTELTWGMGYHSRGYQSLPLGAVNLTEKFVHTDPIREDEYLGLLRSIKTKLLPLKCRAPLKQHPKLVGVGGTVVTLAMLDWGLKRLTMHKIEGYPLTLTRLENISDKLRETTLSQKRRMFSLEPGRADIILAGTIILVELMKALRLSEIITSMRGLRYGYLFWLCRLQKRDSG